MKSSIGYIVTFVLGSAVGAAATYFSTKKRFKDTLEATIKANKDMYEAKILDLKAEKPLNIDILEEKEASEEPESAENKEED